MRRSNSHFLPGFAERRLQVGNNQVFVRKGGRGPPVLLLHGFPETHLMWRDVAPLLADRFTVVCADLRGYGESGCPPTAEDHFPYSKRAMAAEMVAAMEALGFSRFSVVGHDRGGRVAYRIALDWPHVVEALAVLDVLPVAAAWDLADDRLAMSFWPWGLLAQPAPFPERLLTAAAAAIVESAAEQWGSVPGCFSPELRQLYAEALARNAPWICEEYRAAAGLDREHDVDDLDAGRQIGCPTMVAWSGAGPLGTWYETEGGALSAWKPWAPSAQGLAVDGGHFFPEECPEETSRILTDFLSGIDRR